MAVAWPPVKATVAGVTVPTLVLLLVTLTFTVVPPATACELTTFRDESSKAEDTVMFVVPLAPIPVWKFTPGPDGPEITNPDGATVAVPVQLPNVAPALAV